ncbi:hypothetical protein Tco_0818903 [Tanacetum coccineum]
MAVRLVNRVGPKMGKQVLVELRTITTTNQGMSLAEIEQIVAQRVTNAIETIAIYETKTRMARESISQTKQQGDKVEENASNKRKWEGNHNGSSSQQQNKKHKVFRAHTAGPSNKKKYFGSLPLCTKCSYHPGIVGPQKKCPLLKFLNRVDKYWKGKAREDSSVTTSNVNI